MNGLKLIGVAFACALTFASPAFAIADLAAPTAIEQIAPADHDCLASFDRGVAIELFQVTNANCDAVLAEAVGLCLAPVPDGETLSWTALPALAPDASNTCAAIRPSPPA